MANNTFDEFIKTPDSPTIYGTRQNASPVAFQDPTQFQSVGGLADFSNVRTDAGFNPEGAILFPDYQKTISGATPVQLDVQNQIPEEILQTQPVTTAQLSQRLLANQATQTARTESFLQQMADLQKETLAAIKPSEQEITLQADINDITNQARQLRTAFKQGVTNIEGQSIPLSLAYGQTRQLEAQANQRLEALANSQAPLIDNLEALQSAREVKLTQLNILRDFASQNFQLLAQNEQQAQQLTFQLFQLQQEEERYQREQQNIAKEFALQEGITAPAYNIGGTIYDTLTGEAKYKLVGQEIRTFDEQTRFSSPEEFFAHSGLSSFDQIQQVTTSAEQRQRDFENAISLRQLGFEQQRIGLEGERINIARAELALKAAAITKELEEEEKAEALAKIQGRISSQTQIETIDDLVSHKGIKGTVGAYGLARFTPFTADKTEKAEFIGSVELLVSGLTLDKLQEAKAKGATFGSLSDAEWKILAETATKIKTWARTDDDGKITHYQISEKDFKNELDRIQGFAKLDYFLKGGNLSDVGATIDENGNFVVLGWDKSPIEVANLSGF